MADKRKTMNAQADMAKKRYGATTTGTAKRTTTSTTIRPTGNPLKGKVGVKIKHKF